MKHIALFTFTFCLHLSLLAAVPLRWTVETSRATPATFDAYQGETLAFEAALQSYGKPLAAPSEYALYWQTNGMGSAWWSVPCPSSATTTNVLFATWSPTNDVGARVYNCFIGQPGTIYHAAFQLRLRPSPGATPNELPLPQKVIDFDKVKVLNPPWSGGGVDTNTVERIANRAVETNAVTVGLASSVSDLQSSKLDKSDVVPPTQDAGEGQAADAMATYEALEDVRRGVSSAQSNADMALEVASGAGRIAVDAMDLAEANTGEIGNLINGKIDKVWPPDPEKTYLAALTLEGGVASSGVTTADISGKADRLPVRDEYAQPVIPLSGVDGSLFNSGISVSTNETERYILLEDNSGSEMISHSILYPKSIVFSPNSDFVFDFKYTGTIPYFYNGTGYFSAGSYEPYGEDAVFYFMPWVPAEMVEMYGGEQFALRSDSSDKADKVSGATAGNLASLTADGNLADSFRKVGDFATASDYTGPQVEAAAAASARVLGDPITGSTMIVFDMMNGRWSEMVDGAFKPFAYASELPVISATDPTFSNAVLAVGLNIDTNSVAVLNEIAADFGGFPITGTATTVGGLLAALAAAVAWLRKRATHLDDKGLADDTFAADLMSKPVAKTALMIPLEAKTGSFVAEDGHAYAVTMTGTVTITMPTTTAGKAAIFQARFSAAAQQSVEFSTDAVIKFDGTDCGIVKAGKDALLSAMWNGAAWDLVWKNQA